VQPYEIVILMAGNTLDGVGAIAVGSSADVHAVPVTVVALTREISD
jgi:hypothetical protein